MKLSLNSQQKSDLIIIDTLCFNLENILERWKQSKTMLSRKPALTALKTGCTWLNKGIKLILNDLDEGDIATLNRRKANNEVVMMPKMTVEQLKKKNPDIKYWLTQEQANDLSEAVIETFCRGCKKEPRKCEIRDLFMKWEIPGLEEEYEGCQYRYEKEA